MRHALLTALLVAGGCSKSTDPCAGLSGTCLAVTITSTQVARVDALSFTASGAAMGTQRSSAAAASLPIRVALRLPAGAGGPLDVAVQGLLAGVVVGQGSNSTNITPGAHTTLPIDLQSIGGGGGDDLAGTVEDLAGADLTGAPPVILPTAPVVRADLDGAGLTPLTLAAGETLLNADTGEISSSIRAANNVFGNREVNGGIAFHVAGGVGIFSFASLTVPQGATLKIIGTEPVALVSADTIVVNGLVEARPMDVTGVVCATGSKGAGGGAGGGPGAAIPPYVGGTKGAGMGGGGGGGRKGNGTLSSCGGGGGHGAVGGTAPPAAVMDTPGGGGGIAYDSADLVGYHGGSGGGGSGAAPPAAGGGGGGGVQLVAKTAITVGIGTMRAGVNAGGCGGKSCSGGGSGGAVLVEAPAVQLGAMATLAVNGGGGGGADSGGTMRDGSDATLDDQPALGGGTAPLNARGGNGGAGANAVGQDPQQGTGQYAGGGAVGRIRINTMSGTPSMATGSILSPYASTGATSFGTITLQ